MTMTPESPEGYVWLIDKPQGWTSFDVVNKIRHVTRLKKVGHAGTLDPLATGLLILCGGKMTKQIDQIQGQEKEYICTVKLGVTTASYDAEQPEENIQPVDHITAVAVAQALVAFRGDIEQVPPIFSAVKVDGKRAYKSAREGKSIEMPPRKVTISELELVRYEGPEKVELRIVCSKGTYIRSLARDLGDALGVGGYLSSLRRTRIGAYQVTDALTVDHFSAKWQEDSKEN